MKTVKNIYQKCCEIYSANDLNYLFLCSYCNVLFYEFAEFKVHYLIHIDNLKSEVKILRTEVNEIEFTDRNSKQSKISSIDDNLEKLELLVSNSENQVNDVLTGIDAVNEESELLSNYNTGLEKEAENSTINSDARPCNEILDSECEEKIICPYCKITFHNGIHDLNRCYDVREKINKYNGDFIKLLRQGIFCCNHCKKYFENHKILYEHHITSKHCSNKCKICDFYTFMSKKCKSTNKLGNTFINQEFRKRCKKCLLIFNLKSEYDLHVKTTHVTIEDDKTIGNDIDSVFNNSAEVIKPEFPFKCSMCERVFRTKSQNTLHMRIHTNHRPYKCEKCPAAFTIPINLKSHVVLKHTDDRPFTCKFEDCNATFKLYGIKKQHERRHTSAKLQCEFCGKSYKTNSNLLRHQQIRHVDAKDWPHQCDICKKRFAISSSLVIHKRTHTGVKPFGCDLCPKFFRKRSALGEHKKLHSNEKNYVCRLCGKGFKQAAGYWGHLKSHARIT